MQRLDVVSELEVLVLRKEIGEEVIRFLGRRDAIPVCSGEGIILKRRRGSSCLREGNLESGAIEQRFRSLRLIARWEVDVDDFLGDGVDDGDEVL